MFYLSRGSLAGCGAGLVNPVWDALSRSSNLPQPSNHWAVRTDVAESADQVTFTADVPGIDPKDLKVTVEPGSLTIRGTRIYHHREKNPYRSMTWESGSFLRTFHLPDGLMVDKAYASTRNGVLTVTIPKSDEARPRQIEINRSYELTLKPLESPAKAWRDKAGSWWNKAKESLFGLFRK
ncbi:MAG: Hsp20/alpha crystallin family protein [Magnetococcales bacterium]|nr:Hsp20/alpha crystallin family protein [Magnetococcales bacterium]